jgi:hypothetical protein
LFPQKNFIFAQQQNLKIFSIWSQIHFPKIKSSKDASEPCHMKVKSIRDFELSVFKYFGFDFVPLMPKYFLRLRAVFSFGMTDSLASIGD